MQEKIKTDDEFAVSVMGPLSLDVMASSLGYDDVCEMLMIMLSKFCSNELGEELDKMRSTQ